MAKYEAILTTWFGQIRIPFETQDEFETHLKGLDIRRLSEAASLALGEESPREVRTVKPGLEDVCRFRRDGLIELIIPPKTQVEAIGLILYAYDPESTDVETIRKITGADNPVAYLGNKAYQKYFDRTAPGKYRLSHAGKIWVTSQVISQFAKQGGSNARG